VIFAEAETEGFAMTETPTPPPGETCRPPGKPRFTLATKTLIVGVCAFILALVPCLHILGAYVAIAVIIMGITSLFRKDGRKAAAVAGITLGLAAFVLGAKPMTPYVEGAKKSICASNLHSIGQVVALYMSNNEGVPPPDLHTLIQAELSVPDGLRCPLVRHSDRASDYFYMPPGKDADGRSMIACEFKGNHSGGRHVLYYDSSATWMGRKDFAAELAKPQNAAFAKALRVAEKAQP